MSAENKAQWLKLTVVQLKGALSMRGLEADGKKAELVERLAAYEAKKEKDKEEAEKVAAESKKEDMETTETEDKTSDEKLEVAKAEESDKKKEEQEKEPEVEEDPYTLQRGKFVGTYRCASALLTVLVTPFNNEFFSTASFNEHVRACKTFKIKKIWNGTSAAELRFATVTESEDAFLSMKNELASMEVDVYHPSPRANFNSSTLRNQEFDMIYEGMLDDETSFERIVVLDKLPEGTTDSKLAELIPDAIEIVNVGFYEESQGCVAVVFNCKASCDEWLEKNKDLKVNDDEIRMCHYLKKERNANVLRRKQNIEKRQKDKAEGKKEEKEVVTKLTDEDRLAKVKQWNAQLNNRNVLQDRDDIVGYAKLKEDKAITEEMTTLARELLEDTKLKIAAKEKLPEADDQMTAPVRKLVQIAASSAAKKEKTDTAGKSSDAKDRSKARNSNNTSKSATVSSTRGQGRTRGFQRGGRHQRNGDTMRGGRFTSAPNRSFLERMNNKGQSSSMSRGAMKRTPQMSGSRNSGGGSYYDDAPSKKKPRTQSPYRATTTSLMGNQSRVGGGGYSSNQQNYPVRGITAMLSDKMRELERIQQQTLAVQSQLTQNMRMADNFNRGDSYSVGSTSQHTGVMSQGGSGGGYSNISSYNTGTAPSGYSGSSSMGGSSNYGSQMMGRSDYSSNMSGGGGGSGGYGTSSSNYMTGSSGMSSGGGGGGSGSWNNYGSQSQARNSYGSSSQRNFNNNPRRKSAGNASGGGGGGGGGGGMMRNTRRR